ncbi:MAG: hypothetical protein WC499_03500 [Patescibacteria group bacterium]
MTSYRVISQSNLKQESNKYFIFNAIGASVILLMIIISLTQVNAGIFYSLKIKQANFRLTTLRIENERLAQEVSQLNSLANIDQNISVLGMVKTTKVDYLSPTEETLARR